MAQPRTARQLTFVQATNEALRKEMERDPTVIIMGEDIAGGAGFLRRLQQIIERPAPLFR